MLTLRNHNSRSYHSNSNLMRSLQIYGSLLLPSSSYANIQKIFRYQQCLGSIWFYAVCPISETDFFFDRGVLNPSPPLVFLAFTQHHHYHHYHHHYHHHHNTRNLIPPSSFRVSSTRSALTRSNVHVQGKCIQRHPVRHHRYEDRCLSPCAQLYVCKRFK